MHLARQQPEDGFGLARHPGFAARLRRIDEAGVKDGAAAVESRRKSGPAVRLAASVHRRAVRLTKHPSG